MIGRILGNRYEIIEEIGNGGMAIVYKARCRMLNRYVAIKVLKDEFKVDEEFVKKFNRESQAAASLSHPNIVSVYDVGNDDGVYYIVMELVEGITLKEYIEANPKMNWRYALKFSLQICSALTHAHRNGIIHRDIKPHNIILSKDGNCKVTDFGIACVTNMNETRKIDEGILGSVHYISPEHAKGVVPDERSDIYSLGITMYEMLTGQLPFDGESAVSVAVMHINQEPESIKNINIVVPLSLVKIVNKAMAKNINLRYQTADEMYKELYEIANDPDFFTVPENEPVEEEEDLSKTKIITKEEAEEIKSIIEEKEEKEENENQPKERYITVSLAGSSQQKEAKKKKGFFEGLFKTENKKDKVAVIAAVLTSLIIIGAVLTIAIDMLVPGSWSAIFSNSDKEFMIPSFVGETVEDLKAKYKDKDIEFVVDEEIFTDEQPEGKVCSQEPLAGMNVKLPITVHLKVSKGTKEVILPRYINKEYRQVQMEIKNLGLKYVEETEYSEEIPEGYVISQNPAPETKVSAGSEVIITVSKGPDEEFAIVPDLVGLTEAEAKAKLADYDLVLKGITRKASSKPEGTVIGQDVTEGSEVAKKTKIMITVSSGSGSGSGETNPPAVDPDDPPVSDEKPLKTYTLKLDLPLGNESVKVVVKLAGKEVYNKTVQTSQKTLNVELKGSGKQNVEVYYDGSLVKTQKVSF